MIFLSIFPFIFSAQFRHLLLMSPEPHCNTARVLLIEPYYGGSHKGLIDLLARELRDDCVLFTTKDKKWHWTARTSALYFAHEIPDPECHNFRTIFSSSVLNLAEFISLRPDLRNCRKILYFHENQLVYPAQDEKERDYQYGYNQILSALVADIILFNSEFNRTSFLEKVDPFVKKIPSARPKQSIRKKLEAKSRVLYYPMEFPALPCLKKNGLAMQFPKRKLRKPLQRACDLCALSSASVPTMAKPLHIVWPHRWEHDKDPGFFVSVLLDLVAAGAKFQVSIIGQQYSEIPESLLYAGRVLQPFIKTWGFLPTKEQYYRTLMDADVVVSTAIHEFFGVAVLEAVHFGCYPLAPRRLVYTEIYPEENLYDASDTKELFSRLMELCEDPDLLRLSRYSFDTTKYSWSHLKPEYLKLLNPD